MYFFISPVDGDAGLELWKSDGTVGGTVLVKNIYPGQSAQTAYTSYLTAFKGELYFLANSGANFITPPDYGNNNYYLWKTDGTAAGTVMVSKAILSEVQPVIANNKLYFVASEGATGEELYVTDGTAAGTHIVKDIEPGPNRSYVRAMVPFNGSLYFTADSGKGPCLFKTDGTAAGTVFISKKEGETAVSGAGKIYFTTGFNIWQSDGTDAGTTPIPSTGLEDVQYIQGLTFANNRLFFNGYSSAKGLELYTNAQSLLPVTLLSFKGHQQGNDGLLQWVTVNEQNNNYFNVQRSLNGVTFTTVGKVYAKNSLKENDYDYTDANITALGVSKVYYRLQQFDLDGKFTYSNTIQLDINAGGLLKVGPNPAADFTNLYSAINIANAIITVADMNGHTLYNTQQNLQAGGKTTIPLTGYAKGMYTITVEAEGVQKQEFKLVIGK